MLQALESADLRKALDVLGAIAEGRESLEAIRPHLGTLYRLTRMAEGPQGVPCPGALDRDERLTTREREVLQWLSGGKTDRDIACILGISPRTVQKHLQRMYEKLGVETRTAAVARAFRVAA